MRLLVDMNLSPDWIPLLTSKGWEAAHWSATGRADAPDSEILDYARENRWVVLTQDLDFAQLLHATNDRGPSVILLRMEDEFDAPTRTRITDCIAAAAPDLEAGALLTLSARHARLRHLPIHPGLG